MDEKSQGFPASRGAHLTAPEPSDFGFNDTGSTHILILFTPPGEAPDPAGPRQAAV